MLISELLDKVGKQIVDVNNVRWTREELLFFLNMGLSTFIIKRPDVARTTTTLTTADSLIPMPEDGYSIITVNHVDNRGMQYVNIDKLSQCYPDWRLNTGTPTVWTRNQLDNDKLYLFPKPEGEVTVELIYAKFIQVTAETEEFPLKEIYASILYDYIIYRAFNKDSANQAEQAKAQYHLSLFQAAIGEKEAADSLQEQMLSHGEHARQQANG